MANAGKKHACVFTIHTAKDLRILNRQCRSLQKHGWNITLIAISEKGTYDDQGIRVIGTKRWKSKWQRLAIILRIAFEAYKQEADIYHFHDFDLLIPGVFLKIFRRKPVVYDIHEFYTTTIPERLPPIWPIPQAASVLVWCIETLGGMFLRHISGVCEELVDRFSKLRCNTIVTPNFASVEDFKPSPVSDEEWEKRRKRVLFTGTLGPNRGALILLDVAKKIKERRPDIEFCAVRRFLAKQQEDLITEKLRLPGYQDIIKFVPPVDGKELPQVVRQAGVGLSPGADTLINYRGVPNKFFEYMSQAVPIVAADFPPSRKYLEETGCGILVKPEVPEEYVEAIIKLVDNPELAKEMGRKGQEAFEKKYNWGIIEKDFVTFYESIASRDSYCRHSGNVF